MCMGSRVLGHLGDSESQCQDVPRQLEWESAFGKACKSG